MQLIPAHPFAEIVPIATPEQCDRLTARIKKLGRLRRPIILFEDKVLDGRHRQQSCKELGIAPVYDIFRGTYEEAIDLVIDENLARRQIAKEKVAETIIKLNDVLSKFSAERMLAGKKLDPNDAFAEAAETPDQTLASREARVPGKTAEKVAKATGVSRATVERVVSVAKKGTDELKDALAKGEIKPKPAAALADKPKQEQKAAVAKIRGEEPPAPEPDEDPADPVSAPPAHLAAVFDSVTVGRGLIQRLTKWENDFDEACRAIGFRRIAAEQLPHKTQLEKLRTHLQAHVPYGVCPSCEGKQGEKCKSCDSLGWVNKATFRRLCPEESRASVYRVS